MDCPCRCLMLNSPVSIHTVLCTMRSRMASAMVSPPRRLCHSLVANWGGERGAGVAVAQIHELEQEPSEPFVGLVHEPFVDREQRVRGVLAHELGRTSRLEGRGRDLFREVGHPYVAGPVASPARGFHQRA